MKFYCKSKKGTEYIVEEGEVFVSDSHLEIILEHPISEAEIGIEFKK